MRVGPRLVTTQWVLHKCLSHECKKCLPLWASCRLFQAVQTALSRDVQAQASAWGTDQVIRFNVVLRVGPHDETGAFIRRNAGELVFALSL